MTTSSDVSAARKGWEVNLPGLACLVLAILAAIVLFQDGLRALATAWATPEYTHGPVIPLLSGYLFLHQLKAHPPAPGRVTDRWPGVAVVMASVALAAIGIMAGIGDVVAYALILWVGGIVLVGFGWREGRHFWPGVVHLVFMLPIPGLIYYKVTTELQLFSSQLGVEMIRAAGVPVLLDGNIIDLGSYKLHVAEACSGLRYLFPIMSFSYVFATLYRGPNWHKAVLLLAAAPLAVLMNTVRIAMVGVLVDRYGIEQAEGFGHFLEGWVIFLSCIVLLFLLAWILLRVQRSPLPLAEAMDLDLTGIAPQLARLGRVQASAALIASTLLVGGAAAAWLTLPPHKAEIPERLPLALLPREIGTWKGEPPLVFSDRLKGALGATDQHWSTFLSADGQDTVDLLIAWYADQTAGGIHSPEVCLPGGGWEMVEIRTVDISADLGSAEAFPINRAVIQRAGARQLVWFWFDQAGTRTASDYAAKAQILWNGLTLGRTDGALVRLVTPIRDKETSEEAEVRLRNFATALAGDIRAFVPGR